MTLAAMADSIAQPRFRTGLVGLFARRGLAARGARRNHRSCVRPSAGPIRFEPALWHHAARSTHVRERYRGSCERGRIHLLDSGAPCDARGSHGCAAKRIDEDDAIGGLRIACPLLFTDDIVGGER